MQLATLGDIPAALSLLTRLPLPHRVKTRGAASAWAYPIAGLLVGLIAALIASIAITLGFPSAIVAGLVLASLILTTGALHEDGLADMADGFWGGHTAERRLEIMKDSSIGTYGTLALILVLGLKWCALASLAASEGFYFAIIGAAALSRAPMVVLMHTVPNARASGLSSSVGRPRTQTTAFALATAAAIGILTLGPSLVIIAILLALVTFVLASFALRKIRGQTGDVLGATQQISEVIILAYLTI